MHIFMSVKSELSNLHPAQRPSDTLVRLALGLLDRHLAFELVHDDGAVAHRQPAVGDEDAAAAERQAASVAVKLEKCACRKPAAPPAERRAR